METLLPPELEREIFELCATQYSSSAKSLILVAKRVHLCHPLLLEYAKQGVVTSRLRTGTTCQFVTNILSLCTNVRAVDIWLMEGDHRVLQGIVPIVGAPISRLSINTSFLFETVESKIRVNPSVLRHITHLDAIAVSEEIWMEEWRNLGLLPKLSHLAFSLNDNMRKHIVESILADPVGFRTLKLLVSFGHPSNENSLVMNDKRLITVSAPTEPIEDWIQGAITGHDMWDKAEKIQKRQELASSSLIPIEDLNLVEEP
ncbi:hypothetical protein CPB83DRAFT_837029 [Crepidotus variabilis]|uniref:Uncharacterized protein n=1 Tax=Crepidotus variabilis TaxID=179855 RepID=A0A9P6JN81_9AGAR|nr:hypothetical protein CPB83DRAFT_837029 [Crepidotus variabilis]